MSLFYFLEFFVSQKCPVQVSLSKLLKLTVRFLLSTQEVPSGTIETVPGFEPAFRADVVFGGDWFSLDADGKYGRVNFRGIAKYVKILRTHRQVAVAAGAPLPARDVGGPKIFIFRS